MDKSDKFITVKELEGRKAAELCFPERKYDFMGIDCRYDALTTGKTGNECVEEYKTYNDQLHIRLHNKFSNYQIDYIKCYEVTKKARNLRRQPLLVVFFGDCVCVWDLDKADWERTATWKYGNKNGGKYGEKEWDLQATLEFDETKGMLCKYDIKPGFWDIIRKEVEREHPGIYGK